jgi:hypothetical protein
MPTISNRFQPGDVNERYRIVPNAGLNAKAKAETTCVAAIGISHLRWAPGKMSVWVQIPFSAWDIGCFSIETRSVLGAPRRELIHFESEF